MISMCSTIIFIIIALSGKISNDEGEIAVAHSYMWMPVSLVSNTGTVSRNQLNWLYPELSGCAFLIGSESISSDGFFGCGIFCSPLHFNRPTLPVGVSTLDVGVPAWPPFFYFLASSSPYPLLWTPSFWRMRELGVIIIHANHRMNWSHLLRMAATETIVSRFDCKSAIWKHDGSFVSYWIEWHRMT